jgi:Putative restriction endonuclease
MATELSTDVSLEAGENLTRDEFIRIWEQLPGIKRAELIGGVVYMPSPTSLDHGGMDFDAATFMGVYKAMTPGCAGASNATTYMLDDCPQPDVNLRIVPECGGKSWVKKKYLHGSPELLTEVCNTTGSIDLHQKLDLYEEARVQEYLVIVVKKKQIRWHRLVKGKYKLLAPDAEGVYRSRVFPGLWLDSKALFNGDMAKVLATLQEGIASDEHQQFVEELAKRKRAAKK